MDGRSGTNTESLWARIKPIAWLAVITVLFRWKILLTDQFTTLNYGEQVNQGYCWLTFCVRCLRHGRLPAWDPYTFGGHSFVAEMQTSAYYPLNFLLALFPLGPNGLLSVWLYNWYIAALIFLAAAMMYWLARDLKLEQPSAVIAAVCFAMGGTMIRNQAWPDFLQTGLWIPVVFLTCRRALVAASPRRVLLYAWLCGLAMGMGILGGCLHMVMMQAALVLTLAAYHAWQTRIATGAKPQRSSMLRGTVIVVLIAAVAFGAGAIQLLPSFEYTSHAVRFTGEASYPANSQIPYLDISNNTTLPRSLFSLVFPNGFDGAYHQGEFTSPYMGIFPLILVSLALLKRWNVVWVRYCGLLAVGAWLYSLGPLSLLHGVLYVLVPKLWLLRESSRLLYLTSFALALLAGYGAQVLLVPGDGDEDSPRFDAVLKWLAVGSAAALATAAVLNQNGLHYWNELSLVIILLAYWLYRLARRRHNPIFGLVIVAFILFDLWPLDWSVENIGRIERDKKAFALEYLVHSEGVVRFLRSQPGPFRITMTNPAPPNLGDGYAILTTNGAGATLDTRFIRLSARQDLLNVRYSLKPASTPDPGAVYSDPMWKVYPNQSALGEGFVVHRIRQMPLAQVEKELAGRQTNLREEALMENTAPPVDPCPGPGQEAVTVKSYGANRVELQVHALSRGLLVLSELYDPGWRAVVNGRDRAVLEVDGGLRGVAIEPGENTVLLRYRPRPILWGGVLTLLTFAAGLALWIVHKKSSLPDHPVI